MDHPKFENKEASFWRVSSLSFPLNDGSRPYQTFLSGSGTAIIGDWGFGKSRNRCPSYPTYLHRRARGRLPCSNPKESNRRARPNLHSREESKAKSTRFYSTISITNAAAAGGSEKGVFYSFLSVSFCRCNIDWAQRGRRPVLSNSLATDEFHTFYVEIFHRALTKIP